MASEKGYLVRSWEMLTAEKGWYKPFLVCAAISCIPVVGQLVATLGLLGYAYEWARLTAWGVDSVPKQRGINIGGLFSSGWRVFCVIVCWSLIGGLIISAIQMFFNVLHLGFLGALFQVAFVFVGAFASVAALRAAIYQKFTAGFGVSQIWEMIKRHTNGFLRITGITALSNAATMLVASVLGLILLTAHAREFYVLFEPLFDGMYYGYLDDYEIVEFVNALFGLMVSLTPSIVVISFATFLVSTGFQLITVNSVGLWMRQFGVSEWGDQGSPLPNAPEQTN